MTSFNLNDLLFTLKLLNKIEDFDKPTLNTLKGRNLYKIYGDSVSIKNRQILFVGNSGSGKTEMVNQFLRHSNGVRLSKDNSWIYWPYKLPQIINNFTDNTNNIYMPLNLIIYLDDGTNKKYKTNKELKKQIVDTLLTGYSKKIEGLFISALDKLPIFRYKGNYRNSFDDYKNIEHYVNKEIFKI